MLTDLADACYASGLQVITCDGWESRGYADQSLEQVRGVLWHHTATSSARNYTSGMPTLSMLVNGRSDLPGPLCNLGLGRGGEVYVVAAGVANHAGQGSAPNIPTDMGNHYLIGIEMESSGVQPWDWTDAQLDAMPRLGAALELHYLQYLDPELRLQLGHYEYSSAGKIDPTGLPGAMDGLRARINAIAYGSGPLPATGSTEDDIMFLARLDGHDEVYISNGIWYQHVQDPPTLQGIIDLGIAGSDVKTVPTLQILGQAADTLAHDILFTDIPWYGFDGKIPDSGRTTTSVATDIGWSDARAAGGNGLVTSAVNKIDALATELADKTDGAGLTADEIKQALKDGLTEAFGEYKLSLNKDA